MWHNILWIAMFRSVFNVFFLFYISIHVNLWQLLLLLKHTSRIDKNINQKYIFCIIYVSNVCIFKSISYIKGVCIRYILFYFQTLYHSFSTPCILDLLNMRVLVLPLIHSSCNWNFVYNDYPKAPILRPMTEHIE